MVRTLISIALLLILLIAGCAKPIVNEPSATEQGADFLAKAETLARQQMVRFNAIELIYRNMPEKHSVRSPATLVKESGWVKVYRRFSSYTVKDIRRSESLLHPIIYDVEFSYDVFGTRFRNMKEKNALPATQLDNSFAVQYSDTLHHAYQCDEFGNLLEKVPAFPKRPNYFQGDHMNEMIEGHPLATAAPR
jgi:hypothetical protein